MEQIFVSFSLKPTFLKWRPDYEVAADEYSHAATCFRVAKSYAQCKDCLVKAADCYKQTKAWFHAARCIEQALLVCKEMGDLSEVSKLAHSACGLFQQHGSPESGVTALDKAAKMLEATQPQQALELFRRAVDIITGEDNPRHAAEYMSKVARLLVKLQMYDEAADAIRREIGMYQDVKLWQSLGRLTVALVLVQLARGDQVAAEKAFKEWGNFCEAPEVQTLEMLLQAYDNEDADAARAALNNPFIKHMDVEYAKLARGLPLPQQEYAIPPAGVRANAAESYVSPNASKAGGQATVEAEVNHAKNEVNESSQSIEKKPEVAPPPKPTQKQEEEDDYEGGLYLVTASDRQCALIGLDCFSEVCKALNKNRGLYGRWSELQNVAIVSPTGIPLSGSATAISRTDELDWTTTELRKALRSIEWDLDDLEDTIFYIVLNACVRIVEKNPTKFKIDNKELTVQRSFIEQAREEVKIMKDKLNLSRSRDRDSTARQPLLDNSPARVPANHGTTKYSKLENEIDSPNRQFLSDTMQQQNSMIRQQDEQLDMIGETVGTLKTVSRQINSELDEQAVMLDEFGNELETTDSKLDATMKKMAKVLHMSNGNYNNYIPDQ
ncbi:Gamma-soluble NSF attachment protein [Trachymyrmex zeteki]|uniref:Gamma-soluble NSF attachment protein n=1 Tax=Mycetomoellerius zeteki TaxID=64791 RepID=A0A151WQL2_9HYME|nr:Gamma-soluble NSF attachment protein [Trachymyrmex zeteki]